MTLIERQQRYQLYHHAKTDKYEYLTGEEILPSNQQQIIEQAKFTYSPLGKAFEKQTKTIEDKGEKQIKAIQDNRKQLISDDDYKKKTINFNKKRLDKLEELNNKIDYDNLKYVVESSGDEYRFNKMENPIALLNDIKKGKISLEEAKEQQKNYYI